MHVQLLRHGLSEVSTVSTNLMKLASWCGMRRLAISMAVSVAFEARSRSLRSHVIASQERSSSFRIQKKPAEERPDLCLDILYLLVMLG